MSSAGDVAALGVCCSMTSPAGWVSPACAIPKPTPAIAIRIAAPTIPTVDIFNFPHLLPSFRGFGSYPRLDLTIRFFINNKVSSTEKKGKAIGRGETSTQRVGGKGVYVKGETPVRLERFRQLVPRCQAGGKLSTGTDRRYKKSGKGPPEPTDLQGSPGSAR